MWNLDELVKYVNEGDVRAEINGAWVPARPERLSGWRDRLRRAWLVWTDRADVVKWPGGQ